MSADRDITQLLLASSKGDKAALDELLPVVYSEVVRNTRGRSKQLSASLTFFLATKKAEKAAAYRAMLPD